MQELGCNVEVHSFTFSAWPARYGPPVVGALLVLGMTGAWRALASGHAITATVVLLITHIFIALLLASVEQLLLRLPWGRQEGRNLYATYASDTARAAHVDRAEKPRYLIVAHRDSKSQPVPIVVRIAAAATAGISWTLLLVGALLDVTGVASAFLVAPVATAGIAAGVVLLFCTTGNASPGALDNASGVAALVGIAAREHGRGDVAFLITDAEEFGAAGASAAAGRFAYLDAVINLDGLDDAGPFRLLGAHGTPRRGGAPRVEQALRNAARTMGVVVKSSSVPRGLMLDHIPFARARVPAVSVLRGPYRSMARVHRPGDRPDRMTGVGIGLTIDMVCGALDELRSSPSETR